MSKPQCSSRKGGMLMLFFHWVMVSEQLPLNRHSGSVGKGNYWVYLHKYQWARQAELHQPESAINETRHHQQSFLAYLGDCILMKKKKKTGLFAALSGRGCQQPGEGKKKRKWNAPRLFLHPGKCTVFSLNNKTRKNKK